MGHRSVCPKAAKLLEGEAGCCSRLKPPDIGFRRRRQSATPRSSVPHVGNQNLDLDGTIIVNKDRRGEGYHIQTVN